MNTNILTKENILLGLPSTTRDDAILKAGNLLIQGDYVADSYVDAMFEREEIISTYVGNGVAIPHGVGKQKGLIKKSGIVVLQFPEGIDYNGETAYLVIGICGKNNDHIKILSNIAEQLGELEKAQQLWTTKDVDSLYNIFVKGE